MYESPIDIIYGDIHTKIEQENENMIMSAVRQVGVDIDRNELIRALQYDRNQYTTGYMDGKNDALDKIRAEIIELRYGNPFRTFIIDECLNIIDRVSRG